MRTPSNRKLALFGLLTALGLMAVLPSLMGLVRDTRHREYYSHIPVIAAVSAYLIFRRRKLVFGGEASAHPAGISLIACGAGAALAGQFLGWSDGDRISIVTLAVLLVWAGAYLVLFGKGTGRRALFPFVFLLLAVPMPMAVLDKVIAVLVAGSTSMTRVLFKAFGIPFLQEGPIFYLPGFSIEVARECSGIRSSLALLVTAVLAGHVFLKGFWRQALLAVAVFPVALLKNAIRIVTLYLLSYFVDIRIIQGGFLHRSGGFVFFGLGLAVLGLVVWFLRGEGKRRA